jgi:transcriptional regulator
LPFGVKRDATGNLVLHAHLARANAQWQTVEGQEVLVVFQGANAYISPQWYASKAEHGKVVPTWNYESLQVWGKASVVQDSTWLHQQVNALTDHHETTIAGGTPWRVSDAPNDYIDSQLKGIVGLEIAVTQITGKLKASQNRSSVDRAGVVAGLQCQGGSAARRMAGLVGANED